MLRSELHRYIDNGSSAIVDLFGLQDGYEANTDTQGDHKSVVWGKSEDLGGSRFIEKEELSDLHEGTVPN